MADRRYTINAFTVNVDVASSTGSYGDRDETSLPAVCQSVERLLDLLAEHDVRATFFVADRVVSLAPGVLRSIVAAGHEPAMLAPRFSSPLDQLLHLREEIAESLARMQDVTGEVVLGLRTTPFTSGWRSPAMLETLVQEGVVYSSSTYPRQTLSPLLLSTAKRAHKLTTPSGDLWEIPLTAWRPLGIGIPSINTAGGPLFGLLPAWMIARGVEGMNRHGEPALLYVHSWGIERIDGASNDVGTEHGARYGRREETLRMMTIIFRGYRFSSIREAYASRLTTEATGRRTPRRTSIIRMDLW